MKRGTKDNTDYTRGNLGTTLITPVEKEAINTPLGIETTKGQHWLHQWEKKQSIHHYDKRQPRDNTDYLEGKEATNTP